ncbi:MAG: hypothetical protein V1777_04030 [Candidatus Micrarchaeota archaeon]
MNHKGVYSIVSAFMLIVIVVAAIMTLVYTNFQVAARESLLAEEIEPFHDSVDDKDSLLNCMGPFTQTRIQKESTDHNCLNKVPSLSGFEIRQLEFFNCNALVQSIGNTQECTKKLAFLITQDRNGSRCLTELSLCFSGKKAQNPADYVPECRDFVDNDRDGKIDYSAEPGAGDFGCSSAEDDSEADCGDQTKNSREECDTTDFGLPEYSNQCTDYDSSRYAGGTLLCKTSCRIDTTNCVLQPSTSP